MVHACCCTRHRSSSAPRSAQCRCTCRTSSASALSYASICRRRSTAASPSSASSDDANIITSEREEGVSRLRATSRPSFDSLGHCTPPPTTALKSGSPPRGCMHLGTLAPDISSAACAIDAAELGWRKGASSGAPSLSGGTCCRRVRSWSCDHGPEEESEHGPRGQARLGHGTVSSSQGFEQAVAHIGHLGALAERREGLLGKHEHRHGARAEKDRA